MVIRIKKLEKEGLDEIFAFLSDMKKRMVPIPEAEAELKKLYNKKVYQESIVKKIFRAIISKANFDI